MSALSVTMLQAITIGIGFVIGYIFNKSSLKLWRVFVGFLVGFAISWWAGVIIWAFVFMSNNPNAAIVAGVPKSFLFAIVGGGMGVYFGRRKAKLQEKSTVNLAVNTDSAPVASNVRTQEELTEVQSVAQKPQLVVTAIFLLWASLAIGVVKMLLDFSYLSGVASAAFTNFILIFTFVLIAFLISKISVGRNWARITFLFIFIIGVLPILPIVLGEFSRSAVVGALSVAQIGLQVYALFLLFTLPCSSWFRKTVDA